MSNAVKLPNGETQTNATPGQHPLNWFEPTYDEAVGSLGIYAPEGWEPTVRGSHLPFDQYGSNPGQLVLAPGMTVYVESAWARDYIENAVILLYVRVQETGQFTHIPASSFEAEIL